MPRTILPVATVFSLGAALLANAAAAQTCDGAGVIIRIDGQPRDVEISRAGPNGVQTVGRPSVLQVVCGQDQIHTGPGTALTLSVDGVGQVKIARGTSYVVPSRKGAPSMAGNAYRQISDQVLPDMKRLPWNVRLKGAGDDFGFALPALAEGGQQLTGGKRPLLVRLVGGSAPYRLQIKDAQGAIIATKSSQSHEVAVPAVALSPGTYVLTAADATQRSLDVSIKVVSATPPPQPQFSDLPDPEVRAAAAASALARDATAQWSFEAEQQLASAPANGLDRDKVYELIESYSVP
jgi:hypothetical protein